MFSVTIHQLDFAWTVFILYFLEIIFLFSEEIKVEVLIIKFSSRDAIKTTLIWSCGYIHNNMFSFYNATFAKSALIQNFRQIGADI